MVDVVTVLHVAIPARAEQVILVLAQQPLRLSHPERRSKIVRAGLPAEPSVLRLARPMPASFRGSLHVESVCVVS
jgi:hypothetical protein